MSSTLPITGQVVGMPTGEKIIGPLSATNGTTVGTVADVTLASGDNTIAIPSGAIAALIVIPSSVTQTIKVRTNLDSGGVTIGNPVYAPFVALPLPSSATSLVINASAATTGTTEVTFI